MARNVTSVIVDRVTHPAPPGAIKFTSKFGTGEITGFVHGCPCGCGAWSGVHFENYGTPPMWRRTGDDWHMTLEPSIGIRHPKGDQPGYHWHGYLRNGVFEEC